MRKILMILALSLVLAFGLTMQAAAAPVDIFAGFCLEDLGDFTGTLDYSFINDTTATLTVELTNTSPPANGGFITAFAFNNPGNLITAVSLSAFPQPQNGVETLLGGPTFQDDINAAPFGDFDIGAGTDNSWEGGGSPLGGVPVGITWSWDFAFTGTDLDTLTTQSFVNELENGNFFVVRFRGFEDDGSDKCTAAVVPIPAALPLFGTGLLGLGLLGWRKVRS